jgi:hypothetical protein
MNAGTEQEPAAIAQPMHTAPSRTPEARRAERQRAAATKGCAYASKEERRLERERADAIRTIRRTLDGVWPRWFRTTPTFRKAMQRAKYQRRYESDPAGEQARVMAYKYANPERVKTWTARRQALARNGDDGTLNAAIIRCLLLAAECCPYCERRLGRNRSLDHILPLSRGGLHSIHNVIVCCLRCNTAKRDRTLDEWTPPSRYWDRNVTRGAPQTAVSVSTYACAGSFPFQVRVSIPYQVAGSGSGR